MDTAEAPAAPPSEAPAAPAPAEAPSLTEVVRDAGALLPAMPTPSVAAPAALAPSGAALVDGKGRPFDPLIHDCTIDGAPITSLEQLHALAQDALARVVPATRRDGKIRGRLTPLRPRKFIPPPDTPPAAPAPAAEPGAAPAGAPGEAAPPAGAGPAPAPAAPASDAEIQASAQTLASVQLLVMRAGLGPEIATGAGEAEALVEAWAKVFRHYGMGALHPVVGLAMVSGGLIAAASQKHADTRSRLQRLAHWGRDRFVDVALWIKRRFRRGAPTPAPAAAPAAA